MFISNICDICTVLSIHMVTVFLILLERVFGNQVTIESMVLGILPVAVMRLT